MRKLTLLVIFFGLFLCASSASATTYYVDYSSGSDGNNGTSKTTPWKNAPGMAGCSGSCASVSPGAGDSIILKGGVTWPNSAFQWNWSWSGSSGSPVYIGVDQTWFTGSAWARPIMNAQSATLSGNNNFIQFGSGLSYVVIDNLEFTGMFWSGSQGYGHTVIINIQDGTHITIENSYFHNWTHGGSGTTDDLNAIQGSTNPPYNVGSIITHCIFTGLPNGGDSGSATYAVPEADHNIVHDLTNGFLVNNNISVHDNTIYNIRASFDPSVHENAIESTAGGTNYIYNNVIHDTIAITIFVGGGTGSSAETDYIFNNVIYNSPPIPVQIDTQPVASGSAYIYNNTLDAGSSGGTAIRVVDRGQGPMSVLDIRNNQYINGVSGNPACYGSGSSGGCASANSVTDSSNLNMSSATASSQGFTASGTNPYAPLSASAGTVKAGANLTSRGITPLDSDILNAARPASGAWDIGAYFFGGAAATRPAPPTGISAIAH